MQGSSGWLISVILSIGLSVVISNDWLPVKAFFPVLLSFVFVQVYLPLLLVPGLVESILRISPFPLIHHLDDLQGEAVDFRGKSNLINFFIKLILLSFDVLQVFVFQEPLLIVQEVV